MQPKVFLTEIVENPLGSWVMDVRAKMLVFPGFGDPDRSFGPGYPRERPPEVRGITVLKISSLDVGCSCLSCGHSVQSVWVYTDIRSGCPEGPWDSPPTLKTVTSLN